MEYFATYDKLLLLCGPYPGSYEDCNNLVNSERYG